MHQSVYVLMLIFDKQTSEHFYNFSLDHKLVILDHCFVSLKIIGLFACFLMWTQGSQILSSYAALAQF